MTELNDLMRSIHETLNDKQKAALRALAQQPTFRCSRVGLRNQAPLSDYDYDHLIDYLQHQEAVEIVPVDDGIFASDFVVTKRIHELARELDNPPPKDYWKGVGAWFRSKPWSIPVLLVVVGIPLAVQWVEGLKTILLWLGISK